MVEVGVYVHVFTFDNHIPNVNVVNKNGNELKLIFTFTYFFEDNVYHIAKHVENYFWFNLNLKEYYIHVRIRIIMTML